MALNTYPFRANETLPAAELNRAIAHGGFNLVAYGGTADGLDTGTTFTGTDNTIALQLALDFASAARKPLFVPPGIYRFAGVLTADTAVITLPSYVWIIAHGATFLVDEDTSQFNNALRDFFRSATWQTTLVKDANELCRIEGLTFQGRWTHAPLVSATNPASKGQHFLAASNYRELVLDGIHAFDCRGNFSRSHACESVDVINSHFERICSDCIHFSDCDSILIDGNFVKDTGDNSIATASAVSRPGTALGTPPPVINRPPRSGTIITNNHLVNCVVPSILGPHTIIFRDNVMQRTHGSVTIGLQFPPEGTAAQVNILVQGNIIEDTLSRYNGTFQAQFRSYGALTVAGCPITADSSPVFPGEYDAGTQSVLGPWGDGSPDPVWGYLWTANSEVVTGALQHSSPGAYNIIVSDNLVVRTLPAVAAFSDWGFGPIFTQVGYQDPAVTDDDFRVTAVVLGADIRNFIVSSNIFSGFRGGPGIYFHVVGDEEMTDNFFRGGVIKGNVFHDLAMGITTHHSLDIVSPDLNWDLLVEGNYFDIDPYHKSSFRTVPIDGTWPINTSGDAPSGMNVNGYRGWTIRGNTFANVYMPILPNLPAAFANAHLEHNLLICDPVAVGFNASNRGIANIPPAAASARYMIVDSDPTSATWRALKNTCPQGASAMPIAGTWVEGQMVTNMTPTVAAGKVLIGWVRLTTGSAHVAGTDWSPLFCTVV